MLARFVILVLPLVVTPAVSQTPSAWSVLTIPGGVQTAGILQRGKVLAYREGTTIHAYSGLTRAWASTTASSNATLRIANDVLLIRDGRKFTAFASYTGRFSSITPSAMAAVVNPAAQKNDSIILVRDGTALWAVTGFVGTWTKLVVGAAAQAVVRRHVAVVTDGKELHGMSAFHGRWTTTTMNADATSMAVGGTVGIATTGNRLYGFSALRETWQNTTALTSKANAAISHDVAMWWDGLSYLGFSGLRGSFRKLVTGLGLTVKLGAQLAVARGTTRSWFYSAPTGTWTQTTLGSAATVTIQDSLALLVEAATVHAFSAPRGTVASIALKTNSISTSPTVASIADAAGRGALFSAVTGRWTPFPSGAGLPSTVTNTGALLKTGTGYLAFSARTDSFHPVATGKSATIHSNASSAILAIEDGRRLLVFEPRRRVWLRTALQSKNGLRVHLWRTSFVALDGTRAIGFGAFHGKFESVNLPGTIREVHSNSESSRAVTDKSIAAFSATPLLSTPWQYPEFRRAFVGGSSLDLHLSASPATGQAYLALGAQPPFALPGMGDVLLDSTLLLPVVLPLDARGGTARARIAVPDVAGLRGTEVFMQALVVPTVGRPYVTDLASVLLY